MSDSVAAKKTKITSKIVGYTVVQPSKEKTNIELVSEFSPTIMGDSVGRPEVLVGVTYKIKTPQSEHALYITINDIVLNPDTEHSIRLPYEMFINSKNMENFQWVLALTRVISAVFRKGGNITFLVEELKGVFDPKGGYFKKGGVYMPSLVAEIGLVVETHLKYIGLIVTDAIPEHQKHILDEKRAEFESIYGSDDGAFPAKAILCIKCSTKAVVILDGCMTCLNCGDSKCG